MRVRKDSRIHSFGLLDVDVWTLRRFRKSKGKLSIMTSRLKNSCLGQLSQPEASKSNKTLLFFNANGHWQHVFVISSSLHNCIEEFLKILKR